MRHAAIHTIRRPVDNAFLVRERDRRLLRDVLVGLLAVVVLGSGLLTYAWVHIETLRTGYRIDELERTLHSVEEEERLLLLQAAWATHPEQIADRAEAELGLEAPRLERTLFFEQLMEASGEPAP